MRARQPRWRTAFPGLAHAVVWHDAGHRRPEDPSVQNCSLLLACLGLLAACGTSSAVSNSPPNDATADSTPADHRGTRYCEVLVAKLGDSAVHVDVYSTEGLNDCPDTAWSQIDAAALKTQFAADLVVLNGPRYWMLDSMAGSMLQDATVSGLGGIEMRKAGAIDLPLADLTSMSKPYVQHTIHRNSAFHFWAKMPVYELVDATGQVYAMQSYSIQKQALTQADLATLDKKLTLAAGWSYRMRTLTTDLVLTAVSGDATVVQDDLGNTYSLEQ